MSTGSGRARLRPDERREQLLELGVRLLATRSLDEVSIDLLAEEAGISRGLLYHYFGGKNEFHEAVVRRAADQLFAVTAPTGEGTALEQLAGSLERYVDYVTANHRGYLSLVRGAMGGHEDLRRIYEEARSALTGRLFDGPAAQEAAAIGLTDTPLVRLVVHAWAAYVEDLVLEWVRDPRDLTREDVLDCLAASLPGLLGSLRSAH